MEGLPAPERQPDQTHPDWVSTVDGRLPGLVISGCYDGVLRVVFDPSPGDDGSSPGPEERTLLASGHVGPIRSMTVLHRYCTFHPMIVCLLLLSFIFSVFAVVAHVVRPSPDLEPMEQAARSLTLSGGKDSVIRIWQLSNQSKRKTTPARRRRSGAERNLPFNTLETVAVARGHTDTVLALAGLPGSSGASEHGEERRLDGKFASGGWDKRVLLWDLRKTRAAPSTAASQDEEDDDPVEGGGEEEEEKRATKAARRKLSDTTPAAAGKKKNRRRDRFAGLSRLQPVSLLQGHTGAVSALCWPHPAAVYSGSWDHSIRQWDTSTGALVNSWVSRTTRHHIKLVWISFSRFSFFFSSPVCFGLENGE